MDSAFFAEQISSATAIKVPLSPILSTTKESLLTAVLCSPLLETKTLEVVTPSTALLVQGVGDSLSFEGINQFGNEAAPSSLDVFPCPHGRHVKVKVVASSEISPHDDGLQLTPSTSRKKWRLQEASITTKEVSLAGKPIQNPWSVPFGAVDAYQLLRYPYAPVLYPLPSVHECKLLHS